MAVPAFINAIATATPGQDIHAMFVDWALRQTGPRERPLFDRMATRSGIERRWSVLAMPPLEPGGFYANGMPGTADRMAVYAEAAPDLALTAIGRLDGPATGITHLVVASCTGFVAPGIDQIIAARLALDAGVERVLVGFMGCYAAVAALRTARHIVRSEPDARVLVVTVELSTLHLQETGEVEPLLAMLQFGDGAAAAIVSADPHGIEIGAPFAAALPDSGELIRWAITDRGFAMHLDGAVPRRIAEALADPALIERITAGRDPASLVWAVHAGGRSILDAVERALKLPPDALDRSRAVLKRAGNMSSATLMFVLADLMAAGDDRDGVAIAFGPGLAAEGFAFGPGR